MGIEGNEAADALAGSAADPLSLKWIDDPIALQPTVCGIQSLARDFKKTATASWWAMSSLSYLAGTGNGPSQASLMR